MTNQSNDCRYQCTFHCERHNVHVCKQFYATGPSFAILCCPSRWRLSGRLPQPLACCSLWFSAQDKICLVWQRGKHKIRAVWTVYYYSLLKTMHIGAHLQLVATKTALECDLKRDKKIQHLTLTLLKIWNTMCFCKEKDGIFVGRPIVNFS